jgi:Secretion system C-terminal sorting domain
MKNWYNFMCLLLLTSFASYGQNVYQHFSELNGMEDYNGSTNLLYRIYSLEQDGNYYNNQNNIYILNISNKTDSLFQYDYATFYNELDGWFRRVMGYDFWEKNPRKFIVCGSDGWVDPNTFISRFDGLGHFYNFPGWISFMQISRQNDSLVYCTLGNQLSFKSTSGGTRWDTVSNFNAISLSPYNDKVLFASENVASGLRKLYQTTDGGLTKTLVDSIPSYGDHSDLLFYDKDSNYIYRVAYYYLQDHEVYKLLVSNNSGETYSWQVKFTSNIPIYLSVDYAVSGSVYLATGKYIYHSTDFGNTFSLIQTFDRKLVGIYKKPGSSKLYAATYNTIYELDGSAKNIIKQIPVDPEIFKFDPLDIGNKWVYNVILDPLGPGGTNSISSTEIIKDTVLADHHLYKQIKSQSKAPWLQSTLSYERIDSVTGKVYFWNDKSKEGYLADDLSITLGDTINTTRFGTPNAYTFTSLDSLNTKTLFGLQKESHIYSEGFPYNPVDGINKYCLTKDFGLTQRIWVIENILTFDLKGCTIKGVVYGDTAFVVGIKDKLLVQPKEFTLLQNYPNPFNPITTIKYSLPIASIVKLIVYNTLGQTIKVLDYEHKNAGNYSINFNASDLPSGIYFYKLEAGQFSQIRKMILLK